MRVKQEEIYNKIALDNQGNKIGRIMRIDNLPGKTIKIKKSYAIIYIRRFLRTRQWLPIAIEKIDEIRDEYVSFNLSPQDFKGEIRKAKLRDIGREHFTGYPYITKHTYMIKSRRRYED